MLYRFDEEQRDQLLEQAESGMGYQLAENEWAVFLNAEVAIPIRLDRNVTVRIDDDDIVRLRKLLLQDDDARQKELAELNPYRGDLRVATHGSYPSNTHPGETFWRYSAFRNDRRIRNGSVLSGTYLTTENDVKHVSSGLGAVGRYALPNPNPAHFATIIRLSGVQPILCGNSAPNFGQAGGGVEIQLTLESPNSEIDRYQIPER